MDQMISSAEANRSFSRVLREVRTGRTFVVTAHGVPVARIAPVDDDEARRAEARRRLFERLKAQPALHAGRWSRDELYDRSDRGSAE
jgi:prevent-host-death family protein